MADGDLSAPRLPPTGVVRAVFATRRTLRSLSDAIAPPEGIVAEKMLGVPETRLLAVVCELRIPDRLDGRPRSAGALAADADLDADALERVLRFLASRGWFRRSRRGTYRLNRRSRLLREHDGSLRDWVRFMGADWHWTIWNSIDATISEGVAAAEAATGHRFFEYVHEVNPEAGATFDGAMQALSSLVGPLLGRQLDLDRFTSVCDVGGGVGRTLGALLVADPTLDGTLYDLPQVATRAEQFLGRLPPSRWEVEAGDFFASIPEGHDLYVLQAIVHDWGDDDARRILTNVRSAMAPDGRVVVIENRLDPHASDDIAKAVDVLMLALTAGGRERTQGEFEQLFGSAGLRIESQFQLPILVWAFVLAPA